MTRVPSGSTLILTASDVADVLGLEDCILAVERVHALHATGGVGPPGVLGIHVEGGGFHIKAASATLGRSYFAAKTNGNFPENPARRGLPTIQGVIVLCDAADGRVLALMDSIEITTLRTAAATAVAAKYLARPDSSTATIVGCGIQGRAQLRALATVLPIERVQVLDHDEDKARRFAKEMSATLCLPVTAVRDLSSCRASDVWVTCTPSRQPFLGPEHVRPGAFVAAVGADHPEKHEIHAELFRGATVVVDVLDQCLSIGDLHHAVAAGVMTVDGVHAELGQVVTGAKRGRSSDDELTLFDSTGTAIQDVAAAVLAYERSVATGRGQTVTLAARTSVSV